MSKKSKEQITKERSNQGVKISSIESKNLKEIEEEIWLDDNGKEINEEYIIINKTSIQKIREELNKGSAHWDGIYISDYQQGQIDLIDEIILSQSTPLIPEIEKAFGAGFNRGCAFIEADESSEEISPKILKQEDYISNLKFDI